MYLLKFIILPAFLAFVSESVLASPSPFARGWRTAFDNTVVVNGADNYWYV